MLDAIETLLERVEKPARYTGSEMNTEVKPLSEAEVSFAFCFPDTYEVGMSHLGMKILYGLKNARENWWCERVFMPEEDYNKLMRENDIPLYALESLDPIKDFDFIGFTLNEMLAGFLYGCWLYRRPVTFWRTLAACATVTLCVNLLLTPLWLQMLYGNAQILSAVRIVKNLLQLPVNTGLLYALLCLAQKYKAGLR